MSSSAVHRLSAILEFKAFLKQKDINNAFFIFIKSYEALSNRSALALSLVEALLPSKWAPEGEPNWPAGFSETQHGALLIFIISHRLKKDDSHLLLELSQKPGSSRLRLLVARAWCQYPCCAAFKDSAIRTDFVSWLALSTDALGPTLIALALRGDQELVNQISQQWLKRCGWLPNAPLFLKKAAQLPMLQPWVIECLQCCLPYFTRRPDALSILQETAFNLKSHALAAAYGDALSTCELSDTQRAQSLAMQLVAMVERGHESKEERKPDIWKNPQLVTANLFAEQWVPLKRPFPFPERILYILQRNGLWDLERQLLKELPEDTELEPWAALSHKLPVRPTRKHVEAYDALFEKQSEEERVLFGYTRCLLRARPISDDRWSESLSQYWAQYADHPEYNDPQMARAFLVLLAVQPTEAIEIFERRLADGELTHPLAKMASVKYLRALTRQNLWNKVSEFFKRPDSAVIAAVLLSGESDFHRCMARQAEPPRTYDEALAWLEGWERLLALPLRGRRIEMLLSHLVSTSAQFREGSEFETWAVSHDLYRDIVFQVRRLAKSEIERLLASTSVPDAEAIARRTRHAASLNAVYALFLELTVYMPNEEDLF